MIGSRCLCYGNYCVVLAQEVILSPVITCLFKWGFYGVCRRTVSIWYWWIHGSGHVLGFDREPREVNSLFP